MTDRLNEFVIQLSHSFSAIRILEDTLIPTYWTVTAEIIGEKPLDSFEFQFGLEKIKFWFMNIINQSIIFSADNEFAFESLLDTSSNWPVICPSTPTDDILALVWHAKCSALADGAFFIGNFKVKSDTANNLTYIYIGESAPNLPTATDWFAGPSYFDKPWWERGDSSTFDLDPTPDADLSKTPECFFSLDFLKETLQNEPKLLAEVIRPNFKVIKGSKE
jgi:hypothetical protein